MRQSASEVTVLRRCVAAASYNQGVSDGRIDLTNQFLIAMPGMVDDAFSGSVIYLCEHTADGALGLMINKPTDLTLGALFERVDLPLNRAQWSRQPVYFGGVVQTERGFVLHDASDDDQVGFMSSLQVPGGLRMTTSKDVLEAISSGQGPRRALITLGYCGWGAGQLEQEIGGNGWLSVQAQPQVIFDTPSAQRYEKALSLLGVDPRQLTGAAGHA